MDHPAGTEIYPNERFTFPPFPEPHTHTVRDPLAPQKAMGSDGADWTSSVEVALALYQAFGVLLALQMGYYLALPFQILFLVGFGYVGLGSALSGRQPVT